MAAGIAQGEIKNFTAGSYIIKMGEHPQTFENSLSAYGLLYDLLKNHEIEISWVIKPKKEKDGVDFTYAGMEFRSGAFVIPVSYLSEEVENKIALWREQGVRVVKTEDNLDLPVFTSLTIPPKWTLDKENGFIAVPFFKAAGIPASAHGGANIANWKVPEELGICDDIFVLPHADPKFDTHKNLYFWNKKYKGAIWAGCHAVSKLENLSGIPASADNSSQELIQLNFLSAGFPAARSAGLVPYRDHRHGTPPYKYSYPADPVAQYLGNPDKAHLNGSERLFFPKLINKWRPGAKIIVSDPDAPDIPEKSKGEAAITIYGHGFDDPSNGLVMYQGGHSIFGESEAHIAALRAFFNWSFYAAEIKRRENLITFKSWNSDETTVGAKIGDDLTHILNLDPINFDLDEYSIREEVKPQLTEIAEFMLKNPALLLDIRSHTDSRADTGYNQELSNNRVKATRNFLLRKGVEAPRISGRGYGESETVNSCRNGVDCSEKQHAANRRSEFILSIDCRIYNAEEELRLK